MPAKDVNVEINPASAVELQHLAKRCSWILCELSLNLTEFYIRIYPKYMTVPTCGYRITVDCVHVCVCVSHVSSMLRCISCCRNKTLVRTSLLPWAQYWVSSWDRDNSPVERR